MSRVKCDLNDEACDLLVKTHLKDPLSEDYKEDDHEDVVQAYVGLLSGAATLTSRLSPHQLSASVKRVLKLPEKVCLDFANAMTRALSFCYSKGSKATSGKKLSEPVKVVCMCFKHGNKELQVKLQETGGQSSSSHISLSKEKQSNAGQGTVQKAVKTVVEVPSTDWKMYGLEDSPERPSRLAGSAIWSIYGLSPPQRVKQLEQLSSDPTAVVSLDCISLSSGCSGADIQDGRYQVKPNM